MNALLLEDDPILSKEVISFLRTMNIDCDAVFDGDLFLKQQKITNYDIFLLDINVPKLNGLEVCKKIRESNSTVPILMLTAYRDIQDKMDAFTVGADDYLVKPFHFDELYIRIMALLRRSGMPQGKDEFIIIKDLEIDIKEAKVKRRGISIDLTPKEYQLLLILANANGKILSKNAIAEQIWDVQFESNMNTIEVYINFLRKKIDKEHAEKLILTRSGFGYYLNV